MREEENMSSSNSPNILFIQADQLTSLALGCYGHPTVKTPNIDRLAEEGVVFENMYCNSPLCGPSRNSMMSGRLPHRVGAYDNANELPASVPSFTHLLRRSGYEAWLSGKMHFVGPDQLHGFNDRVTTDIYPSDFEWTPDWTRGTYPNFGTSIHYLHQSGPCAWTMQLDYDEETAERGLRCMRSLVRRLTPQKRPFFLCVSFTHPHDPFVIQEEYWNRYADDDVPPPSVPAYPLEEMTPYDRWIQIHHEADTYPPSPETVQAARHAYLGMTSYIDDKVGDFLSELEKLGIADDTVVVFSSDHGDMQGEHGMWYKRTFREWSMRVPLVARMPGSPAGRRISSPVSLVDLFPTFTELGGAEPEWPGVERLDGKSLVPFLTGESDQWERPVYGEYCGEGTIQPMRLVRSGTPLSRWMLTDWRRRW